MDEGRSDQWSVPVERYPDPACSYLFERGTPVIRAVNSAFEAQFDPIERETVAIGTLDMLTFESDVDELSRILADGGQFTATTANNGETGRDRRYAVQAIPPESGECGFLLFTELPEEGDATERLGVDHVASVVSHDLRNPLDVAKARLQAGRELNDDTHLEHVAQAHERMERIIQDVLTLARGEEVIEPEEAVNLGDVAETAWETVETDDATLTFADPLPTAVGDPNRLGRLFENLFRNAIEHGSTDQHDSDGVNVTVGRFDEGSTEGFYVADDGPGIPADERDRVFKPGYSSDEHGTGLGLAIVAQIVDIHGWSSTITAADGGGTRVEIRNITPAER